LKQPIVPAKAKIDLKKLVSMPHVLFNDSSKAQPTEANVSILTESDIIQSVGSLTSDMLLANPG